MAHQRAPSVVTECDGILDWIVFRHPRRPAIAVEVWDYTVMLRRADAPDDECGTLLHRHTPLEDYADGCDLAWETYGWLVGAEAAMNGGVHVTYRLGDAAEMRRAVEAARTLAARTLGTHPAITVQAALGDNHMPRITLSGDTKEHPVHRRLHSAIIEIVWTHFPIGISFTPKGRCSAWSLLIPRSDAPPSAHDTAAAQGALTAWLARHPVTPGDRYRRVVPNDDVRMLCERVDG